MTAIFTHADVDTAIRTIAACTGCTLADVRAHVLTVHPDAHGAVITIAAEGHELCRFMNYDYGDYKAIERLARALEKVGFYVEDINGGLFGVYRV